VPHRVEAPGELDELRRLNRALALLPRFPHPERSRLVGRRQAEVLRLRSPTGGGWSYGELADAFGVSRASAQLWANPTMDRRRYPRDGSPPPGAAWVALVASGAGSYTLRQVVCHFCHHLHTIARLVG
jgi:hypothetical protein